MATFTGVKRYQDFCRKDVMEKGYILLNALTGHRAHIYDYEILMGIKSRLTPEFYAIRRLHKGKENPLVPKPILNQLYERFAAGEKFSDLSGVYTCTVKKGENFETRTATVTEADVYMHPPKYYFRRKAASEKQSINYRIQGTGALCFKIASIRFYNWLIQNNLLFTVLYTVPVHDEINVESPKDKTTMVKNALMDSMIRAGQIFCKTVPLGADAVVGAHWIH